jgi:[acyl-carrier-protein] S-malonyltransferase
MERILRVGTFVGQGTLGKESDFKAKHPSVAALFDALKIRKPTTDLPQLSAYRASTLLASKLGVEFDVVIGHSVGEYSALTAAGIIPSSDIGSRIISMRQDIMDQIDVGRRPAAKISPLPDSNQSAEEFIAGVEKFADEHEGVSIGLYNSPAWLVMVGSDDSLEAAFKDEDLPFVARRVPLKGPFHSGEHYRELAEREFRSALEREVDLWNPMTRNTPAVYSNVTGTRYKNKAELRDNLVRQVYTPVRFFQGVKRVYESARDIGHVVEFFDIGPGAKFLNTLIDQTLNGEEGYKVIPINSEEQAVDYNSDPAEYLKSLKI